MEEGRDHCALCGKRKDQGPKLIVGLTGAVCADCVDLCNNILGNTGGTPETQVRRDLLDTKDAALAHYMRAHARRIAGDEGEGELTSPDSYPFFVFSYDEMMNFLAAHAFHVVDAAPETAPGPLG